MYGRFVFVPSRGGRKERGSTSGARSTTGSLAPFDSPSSTQLLCFLLLTWSGGRAALRLLHHPARSPITVTAHERQARRPNYLSFLCQIPALYPGASAPQLLPTTEVDLIIKLRALQPLPSRRGRQETPLAARSHREALSPGASLDSTVPTNRIAPLGAPCAQSGCPFSAQYSHSTPSWFLPAPSSPTIAPRINLDALNGSWSFLLAAFCRLTARREAVGETSFVRLLFARSRSSALPPSSSDAIRASQDGTG